MVLHKGKVVECGTHGDLLALEGHYYAMWQKQTTTENKEKEKLEDGGETSGATSQE